MRELISSSFSFLVRASSGGENLQVQIIKQSRYLFFCGELDKVCYREDDEMFFYTRL
jgi:hypothetical protein